MKKKILQNVCKIVCLGIVLALSGIFLGCEQDVADTTPVVTSVTVAAAGGATSITKGGTLQFTATVAGNNSPATTVTWSVTTTPAGATGVTIPNGLLTVTTASNATAVVVTATSTVTTSKSGSSGSITVNNPDPSAPVVTSVTVTSAGNATSITKGGTLQFTADVAGNNAPATTVTWSVATTPSTATGVTIPGGLLTVAATSNATAVVVTATSTVTTSVSGSSGSISVVSAGTPIVSITSEGSLTTIEQGDTLQLTATVTNSSDQNVEWSVMPTGKGVTISTSGLITATSDATVGDYSVVAEHVSGEFAGFAFSVDYALTGPVIEGGKDLVVKARWTKKDGSTVIWKMSEWIADLEAAADGAYDVVDYGRDEAAPAGSLGQPGAGNFQEPPLPFRQAGSPVVNIVNGGVNITDRTKSNYDSVDLRLKGAGAVPNVILTDYEYLITFIGVALSDTAVTLTPTFGMNGSPYNNDGGQMGERIGVIDEGAYPVFKATLTTLYNHAWDGIRLELGNTTGSCPDFRIVDIIVEETRQFLKCECTGCNLNGKSISEAQTEGVKCKVSVCTKTCTHSCNICKTIGPEFLLPVDDLTTSYVVPAAGSNYFFLDLNNSVSQYDVTNSGNPGGIARPIVEKSANSVTYTYTAENQQLWFDLTPAQIAAINAAGTGKVKIQIIGAARDPVAETASTSNFRAALARQSGSDWASSNFLNGGNSAFSVLAGADYVLTNNQGSGLASTDLCFMIQHRVAPPAITSITIYAIRIVCDEAAYVPGADEGTSFYVNLNGHANQFFNPGGGSAHTRGAIVTASAASVNYLFTGESNQMVWLKLTNEQAAALKTASSVNVAINGSATPDVDFRFIFGDQLSSNWNSTGWATAKLAASTTFSLADANLKTRDSKYFAIQLQSSPAGFVSANITSIKLTPVP